MPFARFVRRGLVVAVALGVSAAALPIASLVAPVEARADDGEDLQVGAQLVAIADVQLQRAQIARGAKIAITRLSTRRGQLATADVELADGHVVTSVAIDTIRTAFRVDHE